MLLLCGLMFGIVAVLGACFLLDVVWVWVGVSVRCFHVLITSGFAWVYAVD